MTQASKLELSTQACPTIMNHFQCETYILQSGQLRQGIQFSCNCTVKVTRLPEVGDMQVRYHGILYCVVQLHRSQIPMYELFGQLPVCMTRKHGLYA